MDFLAQVVTGEIPDDGSEFELLVEAQAIVDGPEFAVFAEEDVSTLAVGVVRNEIEGADLFERWVVSLVLEKREVVLIE